MLAMKARQPDRESRLQPVHPRHQVRLRRRQGQMEVIAHHHKRVQPPLEPPHRGLQRPDKGRDRTPRRKYVVLQVPAIDHVVPGPCKLDPQATRHPANEATSPATSPAPALPEFRAD